MTQHNHLEHWLAQEREILERLEVGPGPGVAQREQIAHLNGLEQMQAMLRGELPYAAIAKTLDFLIVEVGEGYCLLSDLCNRCFVHTSHHLLLEQTY